MGQLLAETARIDRQRRRNRPTETEQRYRRNEVEILSCQIALQTARIAARPAASSHGLQLGLSSLYRNRADAIRRMQTSAPRGAGWRHRAKQTLAVLSRS